METNMFWCQVGVTLVSALIMYSASGTLKAIQKKQKESEEKEQARLKQEELVLNGVKALLRERIYDRAKTGLRLGYASIKDKELMEQTYLPYHDLKGNSVATELYHQFMELPIDETLR